MIGRDGKNATPALAPAVAPTLAASPVAVLINTPSVTHAPLHFAHEDPCDRGDVCGPFTEKPPQPLRHGNDPLPDGHRWDDVINQARGGLGHASAVTRGADAAAEIAPQFCLDVGRHRLVPEVALGKPGLDVTGDEPVKKCLIRVAAGVLLRLPVRSAGL